MEIVEGELKRILGSRYPKKTDKCKPEMNINQSFKTEIVKRHYFSVTNNEDKIIIYTDGSKDEHGKTGYGLYIEDRL